MGAKPLRLLIVGAHPDDAEFHAGGLVWRYTQAGHVVKLVSATDGSAGHFRLSGPPLATLRATEATRAATLLGATAEVWPFPDGRLEPSLALREQVIRELRQFGPDLVLTHRTCDYHPDHRAIGQAVQDACYLVTVPTICPDVPILRRDPVVATMNDRFTRPNPLRADVVLDITPDFDRVVKACAAHESQFFEWLPFNQNRLEEVPPDAEARQAWLAGQLAPHWAGYAERFRHELCQTYGDAAGHRVRYCHALEISEYARPLDPDERRRLFWFLPELDTASAG
jgi:LmbE family N-acetylglucosaminyl deacetylase